MEAIEASLERLFSRPNSSQLLDDNAAFELQNLLSLSFSRSSRGCEAITNRTINKMYVSRRRRRCCFTLGKKSDVAAFNVNFSLLFFECHFILHPIKTLPDMTSKSEWVAAFALLIGEKEGLST